MVAHNPFSDLNGVERDILIALGRLDGEASAGEIQDLVESAATNGVGEHTFHPCLGELVSNGLIQKTSESPVMYSFTKAGLRSLDEYQSWVNC